MEKDTSLLKQELSLRERNNIQLSVFNTLVNEGLIDENQLPDMVNKYGGDISQKINTIKNDQSRQMTEAGIINELTEEYRKVLKHERFESTEKPS